MLKYLLILLLSIPLLSFAGDGISTKSKWVGYTEYLTKNGKEYVIDHTPRSDWWNEFTEHKYDAHTGRMWSNTTIGSGSGSYSKTSMGSLTAGDTLFVTSGTYGSNSTITNLTGIVIMPTAARVIMNAKLTFGSHTQVKLTDMSFNTVSGVAIQISGHNEDDTVQNVSGNNVTGSFIDANTGATYTGASSSFVLYRCVFDSISITNTGYLMFGAFGQINNNQNFNDSVTFSRIRIDQTRTNGEEYRGIGFRFYAHDWFVTYTGTNPNGGDVGLFTLFGNMQMWNVYAKGTQGYLFRNYTARLIGSTSTSRIWNSMKINGNRYGLASFRIDATNIVGGVTEACDMYQYNTTIVDCIDDGAYITSSQVWGSSTGATLHLKNNLAINNATDAGSTHIIHNDSGGNGTLDSVTNKFYANNTSVVIIDTTGGIPTGKPVIASPVIGAGTNVSLAVDFYLVNYSIPPPIGFAMFGTPPPSPANIPGGRKKNKHITTV